MGWLELFKVYAKLEHGVACGVACRVACGVAMGWVKFFEDMQTWNMDACGVAFGVAMGWLQPKNYGVALAKKLCL